MKKSELFTQEMFETFTCHPYAVAPIRPAECINLSDIYGIHGYLFENLKNNGSVIWFTKTDIEAECKYTDTRHCNA